MSTKTKTLAKSLHTVTVLHRVASLFIQMGRTSDKRLAIDLAATALGYTGADDPYALCHAALLQLEKGVSDVLTVDRPRPTLSQLRDEAGRQHEREPHAIDDHASY